MEVRPELGVDLQAAFEVGTLGNLAAEVDLETVEVETGSSN